MNWIRLGLLLAVVAPVGLAAWGLTHLYENRSEEFIQGAATGTAVMLAVWLGFAFFHWLITGRPEE